MLSFCHSLLMMNAATAGVGEPGRRNRHRVMRSYYYDMVAGNMGPNSPKVAKPLRAATSSAIATHDYDEIAQASHL